MWREWRGAGRPAVFVHGWPMDHHDEVAAHDALFAKAGCARLYLDLPGMGQSAGEAVPHDLDGFLDALLALIETELGGDSFLLCGTSLGALLAQGVAARLGDQVSGLVLRVPASVPDQRRRRVDAVTPLHADPAVLDRLPAARRALLDTPPLVQTEAWVTALTDRLGSTILPPMATADHAALDPIFQNPARYRLSLDLDSMPFPRPALVVAARQDAVVGWRDAAARFAAWPRATFAILDAAGHEFPLAPQGPLYAALLQDWLDRLRDAP